MNNEIMVVNGNELRVKEYNGQRVVTLWDIARLHNVTPHNVKMNFDNNVKYLAEREEYFLIDKQDDFALNLIASKDIDYHVTNAVKNIPVFTESGYLMLSKPMTGDLAWKVQRELVKNYFAMKEVRQQIQQIQKPTMSPELAADQARFIVELAKTAGVSTESQMLCVKYLYKQAGMEIPIEVLTERKLYDLKTIAKELGIMSKTGKPHANAVSAIIKQIDIPDTMKTEVLETNGKWTGSVTKYKKDIFGYIQNWLEENKRPSVVKTVGKQYAITYC